MQHPINVDQEQPTIDRVVDHLEHAVGVMGVDHVSVGSAFTRQAVRVVGWVEPSDALLPASMQADAAIHDLAGPEDFPNLVAALCRRGFDDARLEAVLAENFWRVLRQGVPA